MGSKEYQNEYYLKNKHKRNTREYQEYQSDYYLKNRDTILLIRPLLLSGLNITEINQKNLTKTKIMLI